MRRESAHDVNKPLNWYPFLAAAREKGELCSLSCARLLARRAISLATFCKLE